MAENRINDLQNFRDTLEANGIDLSDDISERLYNDCNTVADSDVGNKEDVMKFLATEAVRENAVDNRYDEYANDSNEIEKK